MAIWSPLHAHVHQTLKARTAVSASGHPGLLLPKGCRILIAVSGGQDSQCLLALLSDLRQQWRWHLCSVHCNHRWRDDAEANAEFVAQWSAQMTIPCVVKTAAQPLTDEASARRWRYETFEAVAHSQHCTHVVTGHTASDRAETLLYNLVRGSGTDGLQALSWQRSLSHTSPNISLVRPLLDISRDQTKHFCKDHTIPVWEDSTNQDRTYARNRMRLEILLQLRQQFNPQADFALAKAAEILTADVDCLEQEATSLLKSCVAQGMIQRERLRQAHVALQRRVIRKVLVQQLRISPQFEHIEKVVALLQAANRSQTDPLPGGAIAYVDGPWIQFKEGTTPDKETD